MTECGNPCCDWRIKYFANLKSHNKVVADLKAQIRALEKKLKESGYNAQMGR